MMVLAIWLVFVLLFLWPLAQRRVWLLRTPIVVSKGRGYVASRPFRGSRYR
jgi:hypothetical protein